MLAGDPVEAASEEAAVEEAGAMVCFCLSSQREPMATSAPLPMAAKRSWASSMGAERSASVKRTISPAAWRRPLRTE